MPFELFLMRPQDHGASRRRLTFIATALLHAALVGAALVHSFWMVDELPPPLVIMTVTPAPPPKIAAASAGGGTPADAPRRPTRRRPPTEASPALTMPQERAPTGEGTPASPGTGTGSPDGTGISGGPGTGQGKDGIGTDPSPTHHILPPHVAGQRCVSCPRPHLPPAYLRAGGQHALLAKICVDTAGRVTKTTVLAGIAPEVDPGVLATVDTWRFTPVTIDGRPVPFCTVTRFVFTTE